MKQWALTEVINKENFYYCAELLKPFPKYKESNWQDHSSEEPFPFLLCCLIFTLVVYAFEQYLNQRQLYLFRKQNLKTPAGITDEVFRKSLAYGNDKLSFEVTEDTCMLVWGIVILLGGGLPYAWDVAGQVCWYLGVINNDSSALYTECAQTSFFMLFFSLHDAVVGFPFSVYRTFGIEQRHGFNKSTFGLFLKDKFITIILGFVIGSPVISGIIWLAKTCGPNFPLYVWFFLMAVSLVIMVLYPVFIAPLFNKYTELEDGKLKVAIYKLANQVQFPLKKLYTIDGSTRSSHSNAFFYGFGNSKMIVLFDTLLTQVTEGELLAILGHEIGHWRLWHTVEGFVISQVYTFLLFLSFSYAQNSASLFSAFGFAFKGTDTTPTFVGLLLFMQTYWQPVDKFLTFLLNMNSRNNEFAADRYSADLGMGADLSTGLVKISIENLGNMVPDSLYSAYHFSHPPVVERCMAIADMDGDNSKKKK